MTRLLQRCVNCHFSHSRFSKSEHISRFAEKRQNCNRSPKVIGSEGAKQISLEILELTTLPRLTLSFWARDSLTNVKMPNSYTRLKLYANFLGILMSRSAKCKKIKIRYLHMAVPTRSSRMKSFGFRLHDQTKTPSNSKSKPRCFRSPLRPWSTRGSGDGRWFQSFEQCLLELRVFEKRQKRSMDFRICWENVKFSSHFVDVESTSSQLFPEISSRFHNGWPFTTEICVESWIGSQFSLVFCGRLILSTLMAATASTLAYLLSVLSKVRGDLNWEAKRLSLRCNDKTLTIARPDAGGYTAKLKLSQLSVFEERLSDGRRLYVCQNEMVRAPTSWDLLDDDERASLERISARSVYTFALLSSLLVWALSNVLNSKYWEAVLLSRRTWALR